MKEKLVMLLALEQRQQKGKSLLLLHIFLRLQRDDSAKVQYTIIKII